MNIYQRFLKFVGIFNHGFRSSIIKDVAYRNYDGYVYNLSVDGDETYMANGFAVHNCRSTIIPVVKDEYNLIGDVKGERPSGGSEGQKTVSGQSTYGGWLRKQSKAFQIEVLGDARAKLFRSGKLSIDRFTNDRGRIYTLSELKRLNPLAFERANLD